MDAQPIDRVKGSIIDIQEEIDHDLQELNQPMEHYTEDDLDFVNLDQLGNCIETDKSDKERKHSIIEVLNQTVKHQQAMDAIDQCIHIILKTWNIQQLKTKQAEDLYELLQQKQHKMTVGGDVLRLFFYDKPSLICSKILRIAKRISAMKLLLDHQKMVYLPHSHKEWSMLLERLQQMGQCLAVTLRTFRKMSLPPMADTEPTTELKEDTTSSDMDAALKVFSALQIDDSVKGVTADTALQDILLKHRMPFRKTVLYKQMMDNGKGHGKRSSSIITSIRMKVTKSKSPGRTFTPNGSGRSGMLNIIEGKQAHDESHTERSQVESQPLTRDSDEEIQMQIDPADKSDSNIVFNSEENMQRLRKKWKNPKCDGCGDTIFIRFDGKDEATKQVITYDCRFVQDLDDTVSSLVYFHDKHCENLRKYKESIRKYVLESQLPHHVLKGCAKNMKNYVKHLLNHKDLLINIHSGKLPRPAKLLKKKQAKFLGIFKKKNKKKKNDWDDDDDGIQASMDMYSHKHKQQQLTLMDISKQREIAVRLLTRGRILKQTFQRSKIKMFRHLIEDDDESHDEDNNTNIGGIFDDIPLTIQYADSDIFGEPLFKFVIQQLLSKQTAALWRLLAYISMQIPTVDAISLLNEHQSDVAKAKKMEHLELVCTSIIQASAFPIGTALHLSGFMSDLADNDLSREDDLRAVATRYINIAEHLVEYIESDHLLALYLECPTDMNQMNVFDIAIEFGLDDFFDNNRVDRVITHMHQQFDFLNPNVTFSTKELSTFELVQYMIASPSKFYYSPIGKWWTAAILYIVYVVVVTMVCFQQNYLYREMSGIEWIMWIANAGYITYEITEIMLNGFFEYFNETSNFFDSFISINWLFLGFLRLLGPLVFPYEWVYDEGHDEDHVDDDPYEERNKTANVIYMFLFALEMILLYLRFATILQRSRSLGPYVRMIITMVSDIFHFSLIVVLLMTGFIFAFSFIIGPDKEPSSSWCYGDDDEDHSRVPLSTLPSITLYVFQVLLGQQEWDATYSNLCLSVNRSRIVQFYMMMFSVLGTVLLLNLLIAMMASTYENRRQATSKDVNSTRTQDTYVLAHRNALIAAPFNIVAYAISIVFELFTFIVLLCTRAQYVADICSLVPVSIDYSINNKNRQQKKKKRNSLITKIHSASYIRNVYFNYGVGGRRFCRYCRSYIADAAGVDTISAYVALFVHYRLDEDDVQLMKRIMHSTGLCPKCFRPYKILGAAHATDRLQRWEIQLEVISYYVFRIFVHIPMILILLVPALCGGCADKINRITKDAHKINKRKDTIATANAVPDEHYRNLVQNVIHNELQQDMMMDLLSAQIKAIDAKLNAIIDAKKQPNINDQKPQKNEKLNELQKVSSTLFCDLVAAPSTPTSATQQQQLNAHDNDHNVFHD